MNYINFVYRTLAHSGKEINDPFLKALAMREEGNRSGKMTVSEEWKIMKLKYCNKICLENRKGDY